MDYGELCCRKFRHSIDEQAAVNQVQHKTTYIEAVAMSKEWYMIRGLSDFNQSDSRDFGPNLVEVGIGRAIVV